MSEASVELVKIKLKKGTRKTHSDRDLFKPKPFLTQG